MLLKETSDFSKSFFFFFCLLEGFVGKGYGQELALVGFLCNKCKHMGMHTYQYNLKFTKSEINL